MAARSPTSRMAATRWSATTTALKLADYVVTEAGFGADLGAEKFLDIKCRKAGLKPDCVVIVATIRALKMHGGVKKDDLKKEDLQGARSRHGQPAAPHREHARSSACRPVVSINRFSADTDAEIALVKEKCKALGVEALMADHWAMGGEGAADVAKAVVKICDDGKSEPQAALSGRDAAVREDPHHREGNLPRRRRDRRQVGARISSSTWKRWASASCRSASPRRSIRSRPTRTPRARRPASTSRCAKCGSRRAPSSSSRSAVRS